MIITGNLNHNRETPKVWFTSESISKSKAYTNLYEKQIVWGGVVEEIRKNEYLISDLFLFPQTNGYSDVKFNRQDFMKNCPLYLEDDKIDERKQFVFIGKSKSNYVSNVPDDSEFKYMDSFFVDEDFYIFMTMNKKNKISVSFVDLNSNTRFENVDWDYYDEPYYRDDDIKNEIDKFTKDEPYSSYNYSSSSYDTKTSNYSYTKKPLKLDYSSELVKNNTPIVNLT